VLVYIYIFVVLYIGTTHSWFLKNSRPHPSPLHMGTIQNRVQIERLIPLRVLGSPPHTPAISSFHVIFLPLRNINHPTRSSKIWYSALSRTATLGDETDYVYCRCGAFVFRNSASGVEFWKVSSPKDYHTAPTLPGDSVDVLKEHQLRSRQTKES